MFFLFGQTTRAPYSTISAVGAQAAVWTFEHSLPLNAMYSTWPLCKAVIQYCAWHNLLGITLQFATFLQ